VSADPVGRLQEFDEENELGFRLLSDADKRVAKAYGVKRMGPLPTKRQTFVIDRDGTLLHTTASETSMDKHADEALEVLQGLR
jgi:peroxiredoxin Q/BCP